MDHLLQSCPASVRFIPVWNRSAIISTVSPTRPVLWTPIRLKLWLSQIRQSDSISTDPVIVSLASINAISYYAVDVSLNPAPPIEQGERAVSVRRAVGLFSLETHATLVAHANTIVNWHIDAVFCPRCGHRTEVIRGGLARTCVNQNCATKNIYPRVMPSVLVLVLRQRAGSHEVLLGRKKGWTDGRWSVLAGFCEIFESLEQTVVREVMEETGVRVDLTTVKYHSSQPWPSIPFASLMSGFRAYVLGDGGEIKVDTNELEDAKWFEKEWLKRELEYGKGRMSIPGETSLANRLIREWLHET